MYLPPQSASLTLAACTSRCQVYILNACDAGEKVQASLRSEAFRCLLSQRVEFFDRHSSSQLASVAVLFRAATRGLGLAANA